MKSTSLQMLLVIILFITAPTKAQEYIYPENQHETGIFLQQHNKSGIEIQFKIGSFELSDFDLDGKEMKKIHIPGNFLPNNAGAPDLPGFSRYIAIPQGAKAKLIVRSYKTEILKNVAIAPAPEIPLDSNNSPLIYIKNDKIYNSDEYYPHNPFMTSPVTSIRGVDAVMIGITPFQYNPVSKELIVYHNVEIAIEFTGGNGRFGDDRLRSRWFDPILEDALINYESLPEVNYAEKTKNRSGKETGYEYLIVIPNNSSWEPYAEQIKDWRVKQGISTGIVTLNDIGGSTATILETYFNNAYNSWDVPPVAVLLMADYGTNATSSIISPMYNNYCVSDNIFADVSNNSMPDIIFARMTAQNTTHLQTMVSKMLDYEASPPTDYNFYNKPITALGWQTERWFQICSETVGGYWREVKDKEPVRINNIYSGTPGNTWSTTTSGNTSAVVNYFGPNGLGYIPATPSQLGGWDNGSTQMVIDAINDGAFALQHRDHGGETGWGEPDFQSGDINSLTNTLNNELVFVFSINCLTGKYNISGECFTEKFHRHTYGGENAGALGLIAASEVSYSFVNDTYVWGMFDNMNPDFMPDYGPMVDERGFLPAFGNAAGKYFLQQSNWPYNTSNKEVTYNLFHHHGGAFLQVYSEVPQNLSVNHSPVLFSGETSFTITANAGSLISLTVDGEIIGTADGTGAPVAIEINSQVAPAEMIVTVTKQNFFRYESTVEITTPAGPYVVFDSYEVNDYTDNNGNGQVDFGETIWLTMTLKNVGGETATGISATISSGDEFINITDNSATFGDIPVEGTVTITDAYIIEVEQDITNQHLINFTLTAQNQVKTSWQSHFSVIAYAPEINFTGYTVIDTTGNNNGILDPGETAPVHITLKNTGGAAASGAEALLNTSDLYLTIETTTAQSFGDLNPGQSASASYTVTADAETPGGHVSEALLDITADFGVSQQETVEFSFADYCYPTANCSWGDGFTGFALDDISNMNNGCSLGGYGDFINMSTELTPGETYTVQWETGYSNQNASLWIDLNNNREFEDTERLISDFNLASSGTIYTTDFTVPEDAYPGNKRMRIRANWQNSSLDPCANFSYGETEDYTVSITATEPPVANFTADQTMIQEGEVINFTDLSTNLPTEWSWNFLGGTPSESTEQNPVISYNTTGTYPVKLTVSNYGGSDSEIKTDYITVVALPGCAGLVSPGDGSTDIPIETTLKWSGTDNADGYKIYFGTDNPPTNIENGTDLGDALIYNPTSLDYETTYYWQIIAYNGFGITQGCDIWSFTTESVPAPQTHFQPVWDSPFNPMSVIITGALWDDNNLQPGSEIGLFDIDLNSGNEICVGVGELTGVLGEGNFLEIVASMDDGSIPDQANGFTPGNEMIFKYWNSTSGEHEPVLINFPYQGYDEVYTAQGTTFVELFTTSSMAQTIPLNTGWNMVSFMVEPDNPDMMDIFQPLIDAEFFYKAIDENGGSLFHLPFPPPNGQWSNTIGDMACTEGYYVKVLGNCELNTEGIKASLPMEISLVEGWNIISYPCADPVDAITAVQPLIDADVLYKVVDENGGTIFHLPFPEPNGQWSNTIGNFAIGEGYYVKVTNDITLSINEPAKGELFEGTILNLKSSQFIPVFENNPYLPMHIILDVNGKLNPGDEIGIFDGEYCVGAAVVNGDHLIVTCSADDPDTGEIDGFVSGNNFTLMVWDSENNSFTNPELIGLSGDESFAGMGTAICQIDNLTGISPRGEVILSAEIYPNPVKNNATFIISLQRSGMLQMEILDILGNQVSKAGEVFSPAGKQAFDINTGDLPQGYYLVKYKYENHETTAEGYCKFIVIN